MKYDSFQRHILSLLIALSLLPLFVTCNEMRGADDLRLRGLRKQGVISCDLFRFADAVCAEKLLPSDDARIMRPNPVRRLHHPRYYACCAVLSSAVLSFACMLCKATYTEDRSRGGCRRYIIKYIHDQDGYKGASSGLSFSENDKFWRNIIWKKFC